VAGGEETQANFSESAVADVHAATDGIPRLINVLCDNALLVGYARGTQAIDSDIVNEVVRDMTFWALKGRDAAAVSAVAG
jgi:general secretion pathway protein A